MSRYINGVYLTPEEWKEIEEATEAFLNDGEWEDDASPVLEPQPKALNSSLEIIEDDTEKAINEEIEEATEAFMNDGEWGDNASPVLEPQLEALNSSLEIIDDDTEKAIDAVLSDGDWSDDLPNFEVLMSGSDLEDNIDVQPDLNSLQNANTNDPEVQEPASTPQKRQRDEAEEVEAQPPPTKRQRKRKKPSKTPQKRQRDEAEEVEAQPPPPKRQRKRKTPSEISTERQSDDPEEDEAQPPPPKRQRKKKAISETPTKRQRNETEEGEVLSPPPPPPKRQRDEAEEVEAQPPPPKRQRKRKNPSEISTERQSDDPEEDEAQPPPPKRQRKKKAVSETPTNRQRNEAEEGEVLSPSPPPPKRQRDEAEEVEAQPPPPKRQRKRKTPSEISTGRQSDDPEEDEAQPPPPKRQRKKKAVSETPTNRQRNEAEDGEVLSPPPPPPPKRQRGDIDEPQPGPSGLQNASYPDDPSRLQNVSDDDDDEVPPPKERHDRNGNGGDKPYSIRKRDERQHKKTRAKDINYEIKFNEQWQGNNLQDLVIDLHAMFDDILKEVKADYSGKDLGRVVIHHRGLNNPIVIPLIALERLDADHIMQHVQRALNSSENLDLDDSFRVNVGVIKLPAGGAALPINRLMGKDNSIHRKTSLFEIINNDNLCLPRAICICWAKLNTVTRQEWLTLTAEVPGSILDKVLAVRKCSTGYYSELRKKTRSAQGKLASKLCELAQVSTDHPMSLADIPQFEQLLGIDVLVISARAGNKFIRVPTQKSTKPRVYIYHVEENDLGHFHGISKISGFFKQPYFCENCLLPYKRRNRHECASRCNVCKKSNCPITPSPIVCQDCNMTCRGQACFDSHKQKKKPHPKRKTQTSECEDWWKCHTCKKVLDRKQRKPEEHTCGEWCCGTCKQYFNEDHHCYQRANAAADNSEFLYIFLDFECQQDRIFECADGFSPNMNQRCGSCRNDDEQCTNCSKCIHCKESICGSLKHQPNFAVIQTVCDECDILPRTEKCAKCGDRCEQCRGGKKRKPLCPGCGSRETMFHGLTTGKDVGSWLFHENHKGATVFAHNMKGYDGYFLIEYLISQSIQPENIIYNGSKIMSMTVNRGLNIRILDSLNFLPMRLASLPKAFGLEQLKKGWFPHYFNRRGNEKYVGAIPPTTDYGIDQMSTSEREEFLKWHSSQKDSIFDFKREITEYCQSDVTILREACMKFRQLMLSCTTDDTEDLEENGRHPKKTNSVDPFKYTTIASVCMAIYKTKFYKETHRVVVKMKATDQHKEIDATFQNATWSYKVNDNWVDQQALNEDCEILSTHFVSSAIGQVPTHGYTHNDNFSKNSIVWLEWIRYTTGQNVQHALTDTGEYKIRGTKFKADGFLRDSNKVLEYHGCIYHGCKKCNTEERETLKHPYTGQSMDELYVLTKKKEAALKSKGYDYECIWECEFKELMKQNPELQQFAETLDIQDRLNPRDSFFGGRTNASKLYHKMDGESTIKYVDFTSLYPWVNKYTKYPIGHPEIITKGFSDIQEYFGLATVKVLPPRDLYHPVLPYRSGNKLKFPLCRTCADTEQQTLCQCNEDKRSITGTWCTPELQKAVDKGYKIITIYEVYHWKETTQYSKETPDQGLFTEYINTFLQLKQQASGWPSWCSTEEQKQQYIRDYEKNEGIKLNYDEIKKNPGLRSLAKLCLNSFWGKFGQRLNFGQSTYIHSSEPHTLYGMITDPRKLLNDFTILSDDTIHVQWTFDTSFLPQEKKTNVFLASMTTCWARLKLYDVLDQLGERVLYYDTDSVVYVSGPTEQDPPIGDYLGELTDELPPGEHITEFVSGGPKNYAYKTSTGSECCKVRGFTLNFKNASIVNFESVKEIVTIMQDATLSVENNKILRDKAKRVLYNKVGKKKYRMVYTKRVIQPNFDTLPYGY